MRSARKSAWALLAVGTLLLAGCSEGGGRQDDPASTPTGAPPGPFNDELLNGTSAGGWQVIEPGPVCGAFCEPVLAVDPAGRVFVKGSTYARSAANGSFEAFDPPAMPLPQGSGGFHTDRHLQVAPDGALWFHSLVGSNAGAFLLLGVQVARSTDGGDTWVSRFLPLEGGLPSESLGADRQWMAFAADGSAYVTFQQNAVVNAFTPVGVAVAQPNTANIWVARSDDDGATWSRFSPLDAVDPTSDQATGQPIVDAQGRLLVPFHRSALGGVVQPPGFAIAVSPDGQTAVQHQVTQDGTMFPALVQLPDGRLLGAHHDGDTIAWGIAADAAGPWTLTPIGNQALSSPWLGVRPDGSWDLVWEEGDGTGPFDLWHAINGTGPTRIASGLGGGPGLRANTDFVHAGYLGGRLLVVTSDAGAGKALLLLEPAR